MKNLADDRDECISHSMRQWVARKRREYGIASNEPTCWKAHVERGDHRHLAIIARSPADVLDEAELYAEARFCVRRDGIGRWTLEVHGDGETPPTYLVVTPHFDYSDYL